MSTKGKYCCLPGCTSCTGNNIKLYKVPNGQRRFGVSTAEWSEKFHQVHYLTINNL